MLITHSLKALLSSLKSMGRVLKGFATMSLTYLCITAASTEALPLALLGKAPPLHGQALHYFADDPATKGYLATPIDQPSKGAGILIHEWNGLTRRIFIVAESVLIETKTSP